MMTPAQKEESSKAIALKLKEVVTQIGTIQGNVHQILVMASIHAYKSESADIAGLVLKNLTGVRGSFRVESVAYWFKHVAGLNCTYNEKKEVWTSKFNKSGEYMSDQGVQFTYDKAHVATLKQDKLRFWVIAPKQNMNLKLPTDLEMVTKSAEIQLARGIAGGSLTPESIKVHLDTKMNRIRALADTGKTKEWLEEFYTQHPDQKPVVEIDPVEKELAELEAQELQAELEELEVE
jgi:hypothetical protein